MGNNMKITELDRYLFGQGTHYEIYKLLGAHPGTQRKKEGVFFAVWAPHAKTVSVVGDFNGCLFLRCGKAICINTALLRRKVNSYTNPTLTVIFRKCVRAMPLKL